ncbi:MAG: orotate phosphoribosyltransferase [Bacteroidota bacterium]
MKQARQIAGHLLEVKAVRLQPEEPFTWASGLKSPIYCDNRVVLSFPAIRKEVIAAFVDLSSRFGELDGIAGVATAGIAHGALLAEQLNLPFIYIRSKAKAHGRQNQIEGQLLAGGRYLVIEDLISTGGSVLQACAALSAAGGVVAGVGAIFTYEFDRAAHAFEEAGINYATLSQYSVLIEQAKSQGYITEEQAITLQNWRRDPAAWSTQFANV